MALTPEYNPNLALQNALREVDDDFLACRDIRHLWFVDAELHIVETTNDGDLVERHLICDRCRTLRRDRYLLRKDRWGVQRLAVLGAQYTYPEDYLMSEMAQADHPREVLRFEQMRRSLSNNVSKKTRKKN